MSREYLRGYFYSRNNWHFFHCHVFYTNSITYFRAYCKENMRVSRLKCCPPFYDTLRKVMRERSVSRYYIVYNTDIHDVYFTRWKKGAKPALITVIKLADCLGVSVDYLIGRTDF